MSYSTDDGVVALAGAPTDVFQDNSVVVTNGSEYHAPPISLFRNETREIPVKTGYQRLNPEFLALREEYAPPTVTVETADESALVTIDGDSTEVLPGEETRVELDPRPVSTIPDGTDDVVPVVQIRNRGRVDAYGSDDAFVFSLSTEDPLAGPLVRSLREHRTDLLSEFKEDGLLVVPDDGGAL